MEKAHLVFLLRGEPGLGHVTLGYALAQSLSGVLQALIITNSNGVPFLEARVFENINRIKPPNRREGRFPHIFFIPYKTLQMRFLSSLAPLLLSTASLHP